MKANVAFKLIGWTPLYRNVEIVGQILADVLQCSGMSYKVRESMPDMIGVPRGLMRFF